MNQTVNIGDIFISSWGYEQTNIDFFQVVARTEKMVSVRQIKKTREPAHAMGSHVLPVVGSFYGPTLKRRLSTGFNGQPSIKIDSCSYGRKWDGKHRTETYTY